MMNFLKTLFAPSLRRQTLTALGTITLLTAGLAAATLFQLNQIRPSSEAIFRDTALQAYARAIILQLSALDGDVERYILLRSPEYREKVQTELTELAAAVSGLRADLDPDIEPVVSQMEVLLPSLQNNLATLLDETNPPSAGEINRLTLLIYADLDNFKLEQQKLSQILVGRIRQTAQSQSQIANRVQRQTLLVVGVVVLAVMGVIVTIGRSLRNIPSLTEAATALAQGDLNRRAAIQSKDELGVLATAFNRMADQLQELIGGLEQRVAERTKDLATVAKVSTQASSILDPYQMLATAVHLTQRGFNLYHAHIFIYDKVEDKLVIVACGWKEGDEHEGTHGTVSIPLKQEQSLVARAGRTRKPVIVNDVRSDPGWLPNPLLPDTQAELAVPMIVGDELLGVLDVQADHVNAFTEESANIQLTLAAQLATALKNALSYAEAQKQAEFETIVNLIGQKIQRAVTVESVLQVAARELGRALGVQDARVILHLKNETKMF